MTTPTVNIREHEQLMAENAKLKDEIKLLTEKLSNKDEVSRLKDEVIESKNREIDYIKKIMASAPESAR